MGGGGWFYVPKVWTPAGGWWVQPKNPRANAMIAMVGLGAACFSVFTVSASKERRPIPPAWHIPSQKWCVHAKDDDPSLR
mmetsp:Transcript_21298/g.48369  ORF Transcript_21298/g.48369 Transcript_21298/m.48369 type:complete len:80 (-) Transcript_21298:199-438(-)|eukprot:CAMPEP_0113317902 /NCGR_PEP_ID=MMETSP0010_2-20120614/12660_1 /TAXON_ID=216773 ORGANISM="Corethron hystrix, Strain 308" /NCGR_SAMPLE_ID=MMETSP0010_2 /ASSEMBLY_ACC=CAM_ASM_000155 /LENGTH=79 /DNA_ID=CAMNT_0000175047 /DNA_START=72 /DNA_END=311 /DNA_ORIENTATION=- /assembly_acc=CAM_ASM_000155